MNGCIGRPSRLILAGLVALLAACDSTGTAPKVSADRQPAPPPFVIHEDREFGSPLGESPTSGLDLSALQPKDIVLAGRDPKQVREETYGKIVRWELTVDQGYLSFTDVIGPDHLRWMVEVKAADPEHLPIRIDHQGGKPAFWKAITAGEKIRVIAGMEVVTWFHEIEKRKITEIQLQPMGVRHGNEIYLNTRFPGALRQEILEGLK
jgi:hypothetical protein